MRDRKLAEPAAPNRLPDEPLPNAAPMSAPLPCWSSTSAQIDDRHDHVDDQQRTIPETPLPILPVRRPLTLQAPAIARNSSASSDAPPTRPPSTSGIANSAAAFAAFTLPPYSTGTSARARPARAARAGTHAPPAPAPAWPCVPCRSPRPARRRRRSAQVAVPERTRARRRAAVPRPCAVSPASRSRERLADAHDRRQARRQRRLRLRGDDARRFRRAPGAAPNARRSRIGNRTRRSFRPTRRRCSAPAPCSLTSCAPHAIGVPASTSRACARYGNGTHTASLPVRAGLPARAASASSSAAFAASPPFIFQLPTTSFDLGFMGDSPPVAASSRLVSAAGTRLHKPCRLYRAAASGSQTGAAARQLLSSGERRAPQPPDQRRQEPRGQRQDAERRRDRPVEERQRGSRRP